MNKTNLLLSHHEVARILDVNKDRLRGWLNEGFITPSYKSSGTGIANLYSVDSLYKLLAFKDLVDSGISRAIAAEICMGTYNMSGIVNIIVDWEKIHRIIDERLDKWNN